MDSPRRSPLGIVLDAEQEFRIDQQPLERSLDAAFEASDRTSFTIELDDRIEVGAGDRPPEGAAREGRQDLARAAVFVSRRSPGRQLKIRCRLWVWPGPAGL